MESAFWGLSTGERPDGMAHWMTDWMEPFARTIKQ
jgi:hypothetical protein